METITSKDVRGLFELLKQRMAENRDWFISLDSALGDGDLGLTMTTGFEKACEAVSQAGEATVGKLFSKAGMAIATSAPSTMGTLMASGFMKGGKALQDTDRAGTAEMAAFFDAFVEAVAARGKSKPGEKTALDALVPARDALAASASRDGRLGEALSAAAVAAREGFERTRGMVGVHGRAAYYQEASKGKHDPGSAVGVVLVEAFAEYAKR